MTDSYSLDPEACQASVSFTVAPWITVQCARIPGHDGLHEAQTIARNRAARNLDEALEPGNASRVFLSWAQDLQ